MYKDSLSKKLRAFVYISFIFFKENIINILQTSSSEHEKTSQAILTLNNQESLEVLLFLGNQGGLVLWECLRTCLYLVLLGL